MTGECERKPPASNAEVNLSTQRLLIREFELTDAEFIVRLLNEESFLRFIGDKGVRTLDDACNYLTSGPLASYREHGFGLFHVEEQLSGAAIGMCGLLKRPDQTHPDIGFAFLPDYQGRGYALESAEAVMNCGHSDLGIATIVAFVDPDNQRSVRLLERLGMVFAGQAVVEGIDMAQSQYCSTTKA